MNSGAIPAPLSSCAGSPIWNRRTKMNKTTSILMFALALAPFGLAQTVQTPQSPYVWTPIDVAGAGWSAAIGINSEGQVVGYAMVGTKYQGFGVQRWQLRQHRHTRQGHDPRVAH